MDALPWILLALALALLLLALLGWWRAHTRTGRRNRARQVVASRGESDAETLLAELGYRVLERQVTADWHLTVDSDPVPVRCRADLLVERDGLCFVAEVKTGVRAPDPTHPATRRQLLEYLHVFEVEGALLVDMEARRVHRVAFPRGSP